MAELRKNRVKHELSEGRIATIACGPETGDMIEYLGHLGFDGVWIETEHGPIDYADIPNLTRACDLWGMTSVVRVNLNLPGVIYRTFDVGAQAVVVPHVNTAEEARAVVEAGKFYPLGLRGCYTSRQGVGVQDYFTKANDETMLIVLIEDIVAVENLDEILKVDGIDVFFVANGDLAQSMGYLGQPMHPEVKSTADQALGRIIDAGKVAGAVVNDTNVESYMNLGVRFLMNAWTEWVESGSRAYLQRVRDARG